MTNDLNRNNMKIFDLEQQIMHCWHVIDDIETVTVELRVAAVTRKARKAASPEAAEAPGDVGILDRLVATGDEEAVAQFLADHRGGHRGAARRQFVDDGNVEVGVGGHRQGARNGRGGHG